MKNKEVTANQKLVKRFDRLVRFVKWCDSHGVFRILIDILLRLIIYFLSK